jgi:hypothetical protein
MYRGTGETEGNKPCRTQGNGPSRDSGRSYPVLVQAASWVLRRREAKEQSAGVGGCWVGDSLGRFSTREPLTGN